MKKQLFLLFIIVSIQLNAQQATNYSQFMLNDYGLNPAVAGSGRGIQFMAGRRTQWRGFGLGPESSFLNACKAFGKHGYSRMWHGVGISAEGFNYGVFTQKAAYVSYAIHFKLSPKFYMSFGLGAGVKSLALSSLIQDANDPAYANKNQKVTIPDVYPGLYLYSKKASFSFCLRNIYKGNLKQGDKFIGSDSASGSKLRPVLYFTANKKILSGNYDFLVVPAIHIQTNFAAIPLIHYNVMCYYKKRVGLGLTYKMHDAVAVILSVRIWNNLIVGFAYDYTISKFRYAHANSDEIMMGFSPVMSNDAYNQPPGAADCPKFELPF